MPRALRLFRCRDGERRAVQLPRQAEVPEVATGSGKRLHARDGRACGKHANRSARIGGGKRPRAGKS
jgi:hypothetical protein